MQIRSRLLFALPAVALAKAGLVFTPLINRTRNAAFPATALAKAGFLLTLFFGSFSLSAQIDDPESIFRELRALEGTWFMPTNRGDRLESWQIADDSTMIGRGFRIKPENGDTVTLETLRLELRDTTITYFAIARGQNQNKAIPFRLTMVDDEDYYVFENPAHDDPQKIRYRLLGNRELQVTTEGKRNNRTVTQDFVFEREFTPGAVEFRLRGGVNAHTMRGTGTLIPQAGAEDPVFGWKPGWELGAQVLFKGRGGLINVNCELSLAGKFAHAKSTFEVFDSFPPTIYVRDGTYSTIWLNIAVAPEITFKREGRLSLIIGPYLGVLLNSRMNGTVEPQGENKLFDANNDFKKTDFGVIAGFQYKLNFGKKDLGGKLGLRANLGLADINDLYGRGIESSALANGRVALLGASLYYSVNLLKL